jgi:membrane-associated protease RseP (regulator of RpoE activity)
MVSIYIYDITFLVLFTLAVIIFLVKKRKNLKRDGWMYLYPTKVGIKFIDYVGGKFKKTLSVLSYVSVICGYILMATMIYLLYTLLRVYLFQPQIVKAIKIPPLLPLIPYVPEIFKLNFLPPFYFTYWIIAIAVIAICHEFSHGIFARRYGVKIKSTGFGFLGPLLAAFVEPDEKQMQKKPKFQQITILSAGTFANVVLTIIFFLLLLGFFAIAYHPAGVMFDNYATVNVNINAITIIDGIQVNNQTSAGLLEIINKNNLKDNVFVGDSKDSANLTTISVNGKNFLIPMSTLKSGLEKDPALIEMYSDAPAIRTRLKGVIVKIDNNTLHTRNDLVSILQNYKPGQNMTIITKTDSGDVTNIITLGEDPFTPGRPMIGIAYASQTGSVISQIFAKLNLFRQPGTAYEALWNPEFTLFIYNLLWWLILINFSVALVNMWPVAIFDGGRAFMLTIWAITKSENFAKIAFKVVTYIILGSLILLMYGWVMAMF